MTVLERRRALYPYLARLRNTQDDFFAKDLDAGLRRMNADQEFAAARVPTTSA